MASATVRRRLHMAVMRNFGREQSTPPPPPRALPDTGGPYGHTSFTAPTPGRSPYLVAAPNYAEQAVETGPVRAAMEPLQDRPEDDSAVLKPFGGTQFDASKSADKRARAQASELWAHTEEGWDEHAPRVNTGMRGNPYPGGTPIPDRPTAHQSPSNFRFLALPYGIFRTPRQLSGEHASFATLPHTYPEIGMAPQRRFRNTYRLEPAPRDAENIDIPADTGYPDVPAAVFHSPDVPFSPSRGGSYRL